MRGGPGSVGSGLVVPQVPEFGPKVLGRDPWGHVSQGRSRMHEDGDGHSFHSSSWCRGPLVGWKYDCFSCGSDWWFWCKVADLLMATVTKLWGQKQAKRRLLWEGFQSVEHDCPQIRGGESMVANRKWSSVCSRTQNPNGTVGSYREAGGVQLRNKVQLRRHFHSALRRRPCWTPDELSCYCGSWAELRSDWTRPLLHFWEITEASFRLTWAPCGPPSAFRGRDERFDILVWPEQTSTLRFCFIISSNWDLQK